MNNQELYNEITLSDVSDEITISPSSNITDPYQYTFNWNTTNSGTMASPTISISPNTIGNYGADTITLGDVNWTTSHTSLDVKGDANFEGDIKIKGKSILDSLEKIEEKLAILRPNEELEEKWEQLRNLRKQYIELEKDIIEKQKIWDILKK